MSLTPQGAELALDRRGDLFDLALDTRTATALTAYLGGRNEGPLLLGESPTRAPGRLTRFGADYMLKRLSADAGLDQVCFGWAGPVERGLGHYYSLSGPSLLIEYDNTQDRANHIHSVWRDLRRDWGTDLLAEHHAEAHG